MGMLDRKNALVTGAGRGIGRGIALAMAKAGAAVVVNDLGTSLSGEGQDISAAQQVVNEIRAAGGRAEANTGNVADYEQGQAMVQQVVDSFGRVDILVNVAGILRDRMIFNMSEEEWDAVIAVHLKGTFNTTSMASRLMRAQGGGRIINFASTSALGAPGQPNYAAAKAGIIGFTWSCAMALKKYGLTSNAIMPSADTRMIDSTPRGREQLQQTGKLPSEAATGTPRDPENVAPLIVYLASDAAQGVNGQIFYAAGYEIGILPQPHLVRVLRQDHRWEPEQLAEFFPSTLAKSLKEPPTASGFAGMLREMPDDAFSRLDGGVLFWERSS